MQLSSHQEARRLFAAWTGDASARDVAARHNQQTRRNVLGAGAALSAVDAARVAFLLLRRPAMATPGRRVKFRA